MSSAVGVRATPAPAVVPSPIDDAPPASPGRRRIPFTGLIVLATAFAGALYAFGITGSPANLYYAAAARSMSLNWENFLFGAFDPSGFTTIDKSPAGIWPQALSVALFGPHAWALLLPQVLAGAATVPILAVAVRRWAGPAAGVLAAFVFTLTPITAATARVNLPDTFLVLTLVTAVALFQSALATGRLSRLVLAGVALGLAFNVKLAQGLVLLPVLGLVHLFRAEGPLRRRLAHSAVFGAVTIGVSSLWLLAVALTPAGSRPYVDGSVADSAWQMAFGYNLTARAAIPDIPEGQGFPWPLGDGQPIPLNQGGWPGLERLLNPQLGGQISWLLPLAALLLFAGLRTTRKRGRTDAERTGWYLWGGWLTLYALLLSGAVGIHPYYTVVLTPAIAAVVGVGTVLAVRAWREGVRFTWVLPVGIVVTGAWATVVLSRTPDHLPWLSPVVGTATAVSVVALGVFRFRRIARSASPALLAPVAAVAVVAVLAAPLAWTLSTLNPPGSPLATFFQTFDPLAGPRPPGDAPAGEDSPPARGELPGTADLWGMIPVVDPRLRDLLLAERRGERYLMATTGATAATPYIAGLGLPILPMGGFAGTAPAPTPDGLSTLIKSGELRYVLLGGFHFDSPTGLARKRWLAANCSRVEPSRYSADPKAGSVSVLYDCVRHRTETTR
ncbi:ArnT family glycosyltransferase [Rhizohabitans arisaemae]|uniref:ArnT family glycosyltransferase n=1 Tax=Rhizohabitans arisaemae TaxID=2720610 RepID=UPI0024B0FF72|nr:glycosyltransferase family 39 protein [Rhizohabitans arisaemae]